MCFTIICIHFNLRMRQRKLLHSCCAIISMTAHTVEYAGFVDLRFWVVAWPNLHLITP